MATRAVTDVTLGAWVFKSTARDWSAADRIETRCIADNYRKDLMRPGQRALLWVSGPASGPTPRGIWGLGWIAGESQLDADDGWVAHTDITLLDDADRVLATDLSELPGLSSMEVLKLPQGSNPSWITKDQLTLIEPLLPEWPAR